MPDEFEQVLAGAGDERAIPDASRERLERTLLDRSWAREVPPELDGIDAPRSLPQRARAGLEHHMAAVSKEALAELDTDREMPTDVRIRLERALTPSRVQRRAVVVRALAVAASVMLLASGVLTIARDPGGHPGSPPADVQAFPRTDPGTPASSPGVPPGLPSGSASSVDVFTTDPNPVGLTPGAGSSFDTGAPPFAYGDADVVPAPMAPALTAGPPGDGVEAPSPPPPPPLSIGIVRGEAEIEAGFRAYVGELNEGGGVRGRTFTLVTVSSSRPSPSTIATVNLSGDPLATSEGAPAWTNGPMLETLSATEDILRDGVFGFASAPERQAHLIADHFFPQSAPGSTAVIYSAGAPLYTAGIPEALETVLRARGVTPIRVTFDPSSQTHVFVPGDAAFLSMDRAASTAWLESSRAAGHAPSLGVGTLYPQFDERARAATSMNVRVLSPYSLSGARETQALREGAGKVTAATIHGWVTAKMLAVATYEGYATDAVSVRKALTVLRGYRNGFAPAYQVRRGTTSRTPEGLVFSLTDQGLVARTGFLKDSF